MAQGNIIDSRACSKRQRNESSDVLVYSVLAPQNRERVQRLEKLEQEKGQRKKEGEEEETVCCDP